MVKKTSLSLMIFIAVAAILMLFFNFNSNNAVSGSFSAIGGGQYYYGKQIVQFSPEDACRYIGCAVGNPIHLTPGAFGAFYVACDCVENGIESIKWVPMVQVINFNR